MNFGVRKKAVFCIFFSKPQPMLIIMHRSKRQRSGNFRCDRPTAWEMEGWGRSSAAGVFSKRYDFWAVILNFEKCQYLRIALRYFPTNLVWRDGSRPSHEQKSKTKVNLRDVINHAAHISTNEHTFMWNRVECLPKVLWERICLRIVFHIVTIGLSCLVLEKWSRNANNGGAMNDGWTDIDMRPAHVALKPLLSILKPQNNGPLYTVSRKKCHWFFCCNFYKYCRIFIIFSAQLHKRMQSYWRKNFLPHIC